MNFRPKLYKKYYIPSTYYLIHTNILLPNNNFLIIINILVAFLLKFKKETEKPK